MPAAKLIGTILLAGLAASFTDWVFMDVLVHKRYATHPEVWRPGGETRRIVLSQIVGTAASAAVVGLTLLAPGHPFAVALSAWFAGPLPIAAQQSLWMRVDPVVAASHSTGWLVRLVLGAALASWVAPSRS